MRLAPTFQSLQKRRVLTAGLTSLAAALALVLSACGNSTNTLGGNTGGAVPTSTVTCPTTTAASLHLVQPNTLTIASDTTYAPAEYPDPTNATHFIGYDMDLIREVARRMCLQPNIVKATFDDIIPSISVPSLGKQRYDLSISSFTINDDRLKKVNMIPYLTAGESILVPKGNPKHITKFEDMCGLTIAVQNGTVELDELKDANGTGTGASSQAPVCKQAGKPITIVNNDDQGLVVQQVLNGRADATYQDEPVTIYYVFLNKNKLENGPRTVAPSPQGIVVRKDNKPLEDAITAALCSMEADGTYKRILESWQASGEAFQTPNCPA
jgi:polar amino acid transport system substrate-binding protein